MKLIKIKCPNCGGVLTVDKDKKWATCEFCSQKFYLDDEKQAAPLIQIQIQNEAGKSTSSGMKKIAVLPVLFAGLFLFFMTAYGTFRKHGTEEIHEPESKEIYRTVPESAPVREFTEAVFGKSWSAVTKQEYEQVAYIGIGKASDQVDAPWVFTWSAETDENGYPVNAQTVSVDEDAPVDLKDLQAFHQLRAFRIEPDGEFVWNQKYDGKYDFRNLSKLQVVFMPDVPVSMAADSFASPEQLTAISFSVREKSDFEALRKFTGLRELHFGTINRNETDSLEFLSSFTKLEKLDLSLSSEAGWDLSPLSSLTALKQLSLSSGSEFAADLSVLYGLPQMEELSLAGLSQLRTLDFVRNMPHLRSLSVQDCPLDHLDGIAGNIVLESIRFNHCDLRNLTALATVTNLTELTLLDYMSFNADAAFLRPLSRLNQITVNGELLPLFAGMNQIETASIYFREGNFQADSLAELQGLKKLHFLPDCASNADGNLAAVLASLPQLEEVSGLNSKLYDSLQPEADAAQLFGSDSIRSLSFVEYGNGIRYSAFEISLNHMEVNTVLRRLALSNCHFRNMDEGGERHYFVFDQPELGEYANEFLSRFTALEELDVSSCHLNDLEFVRHMPELRIINLADNPVTDIAPLLDCRKLETIICDTNGIRNLNLLPEQVQIIRK